MSTAIARNFQIGISPTATNNFTLYQPATPDGTLRLGNGNTGTTSSLLTLTSAGNLGIGTTSPTANLEVIGAISSVNGYQDNIVLQNALSGSRNRFLLGQSLASGAYIYTDAPGGVASPLPMTFWTAGTERARIDSSGNVGIGTTSPVQRLEVVGNVDITTVAANGNGLRIRTPSGSGSPAIIQFTNNPVTAQWGFITSPAAGVLTFGNATEYARFDSNGRVLIATTTAYSDGAIGTPILQWTTLVGARGGAVSRADSTGSASHLAFVNPNGLVGNIASSGTTTSYATSSDYRLKHDIAPMTGALAKVAALKPVTYKWNADNRDGEGFIAHELAEVCPQAVTGEKDAVDKNGKPVYQGIDTSFLVATLTAAIQELKAEFDAYKATHP